MAKCQKMECPIGCKGMERTSDGATKSSNSRSTDWSMRYSPHEAFSRDSGETRPDRRDLSARFFLLPLSRNVLGTYVRTERRRPRRRFRQVGDGVLWFTHHNVSYHSVSYLRGVRPVRDKA